MKINLGWNSRTRVFYNPIHWTIWTWFSVGTGKNKPNRQIRFVPNNKDDYGPNRGQVDRYERNTRQRLAKIEKSIINDYVLRKKRKQFNFFTWLIKNSTHLNALLGTGALSGLL